MAALLVVLIAVAVVWLTVRVWSRREYGEDDFFAFPERARRRGGRVYYRCWRVV